jgi:hypothetical protein
MKVKFKTRADGSPLLFTKSGLESRPVSYRGIAILAISTTEVYMAVGDYFKDHGGFLESGAVYLIEKIGR